MIAQAPQESGALLLEANGGDGRGVSDEDHPGPGQVRRAPQADLPVAAAGYQKTLRLAVVKAGDALDMDKLMNDFSPPPPHPLPT